MTMPSEQKMREAIVLRDKAFDGRFFYGVITTGVFCRPSCSARFCLAGRERQWTALETREPAEAGDSITRRKGVVRRRFRGFPLLLDFRQPRPRANSLQLFAPIERL